MYKPAKLNIFWNSSYRKYLYGKGLKESSRNNWTNETKRPVHTRTRPM